MTDRPAPSLTPGNFLLTEPKNRVGSLEFHSNLISAINCTETIPTPAALPEAVQNFVRQSVADATRQAYRSDLAHFERWGGRVPASDAELAAYLADHAGKHAPATLARRLASISKAHRAAGYPNPARSELVKATLVGIRRTHGSAQAAAKPLLRDELFQVLDCMGDRLRDTRDHALLLVGFAGGFRRSELVGLDVGDIAEVRQGMVVSLRRSKTDQEGRGRQIGIPHGRTRHCPVLALAAWRTASAISEGPIFRPVDRHGHIDAARLSGDAVSVIVRERVAAADIDPAGFSGHSLRAGFVTSAAQAGISSWKIRAQTGHASDAMLGRYVRDGQIFIDNAAGALL